jgi:hypothetical protein
LLLPRDCQQQQQQQRLVVLVAVVVLLHASGPHSLLWVLLGLLARCGQSILVWLDWQHTYIHTSAARDSVMPFSSDSQPPVPVAAPGLLASSLPPRPPHSSPRNPLPPPTTPRNRYCLRSWHGCQPSHMV